MSRRQAVILFCLLLPLVAAGCRVRPYWLRTESAELPPEAFTGRPELQDVIYAVNSNTERVQQLQTENATLRGDGAPATLRANLAYERPLNFRLQAQLSQLTGQELDLGSNSELFWFWLRRDEQPAVYYARHSEFATSPVRNLIPIEPNRLIDTLGLVYLDPQGRHQGPTERESNRLEVRSQIPSPRGDMTRVLLLDAKYGWIVEQQFYDANGQLLVSARASRHRYYREDAVTMPHHVEVSLMPGQPTQMSFDVDVGRYVFNRLAGQSGGLFAMPEINGSPSVDVADPRFRPPLAAVPRGPYGEAMQYGQAYARDPAVPDQWNMAAGIPGGVDGQPRTANLPVYRGYDSAVR